MIIDVHLLLRWYRENAVSEGQGVLGKYIYTVYTPIYDKGERGRKVVDSMSRPNGCIKSPLGKVWASL